MKSKISEESSRHTDISFHYCHQLDSKTKLFIITNKKQAGTKPAVSALMQPTYHPSIPEPTDPRCTPYIQPPDSGLRNVRGWRIFIFAYFAIFLLLISVQSCSPAVTSARANRVQLDVLKGNGMRILRRKRSWQVGYSNQCYFTLMKGSF